MPPRKGFEELWFCTCNSLKKKYIFAEFLLFPHLFIMPCGCLKNDTSKCHQQGMNEKDFAIQPL